MISRIRCAATGVVVAPMHRDHADGARLFPKARIWAPRDQRTGRYIPSTSNH